MGHARYPDPARFAVHLDVIVDGKRVSVPPGIGSGGRLVAALYTSDGSGIVHVDSDDDQGVFTLGQFFDEWQVALSPWRLGGPGSGFRTAIPVSYAFPAGT